MANRRRRFWVLSLTAIVLAALGGSIWLAQRPIPYRAELQRELVHRGRLALLGRLDLTELSGSGTQVLPLSSLPALGAALETTDEKALAKAMDATNLQGILVDSRDQREVAKKQSIHGCLTRFAHLTPLRAIYISPLAAIYLRDSSAEIPPHLGHTLARVARVILDQESVPSIDAFPELLRRPQGVEIMVSVWSGDRRRLWRSSRASSVAEALLRASKAARLRWQERKEEMGGPLEMKLGAMDITVSILKDDGTLGDRTPSFLNRAISKSHGIAYEDEKGWGYLLRESAWQAGRGSMARAYRHLFGARGLSPGSLSRPRIRLYRVAEIKVGTSSSRSDTAEGVR